MTGNLDPQLAPGRCRQRHVVGDGRQTISRRRRRQRQPQRRRRLRLACRRHRERHADRRPVRATCFILARRSAAMSTRSPTSRPADGIYLDTMVFADLAAGALAASAFRAGAAATTAAQRIIYNSANGQILYDADGNGAGAAILFATVNPGTALTAGKLLRRHAAGRSRWKRRSSYLARLGQVKDLTAYRRFGHRWLRQRAEQQHHRERQCQLARRR